MKVFTGVYTNQVKDYCDEKFFTALTTALNGQHLMVVDNTEGVEYTERLTKMLSPYENATVKHIDVFNMPSKTRFHRNVLESVRMIRNHFLADKSYDAFLIAESDVIFEVDTLDRLIERAIELEAMGENWGGIGALYYEGFHDYMKFGLCKTHHVLSGCTLYSRKLIEAINFRIDFTDLKPFPDALISYDAQNFDPPFTLWDDHDIRLEHAHNPKTGTRYTKGL